MSVVSCFSFSFCHGNTADERLGAAVLCEARAEADACVRRWLHQAAALHCGQESFQWYLRLRVRPEAVDIPTFRLTICCSVSFGPDICGTQTRHTKLSVRVRGSSGDAYFTYAKRVRCETDELTHRYTLVLKHDGFEILIDGRRKSRGQWNFDDPSSWTPESRCSVWLRPFADLAPFPGLSTAGCVEFLQAIWLSLSKT